MCWNQTVYFQNHNGQEDSVDHFAEKLCLFCICHPYLAHKPSHKRHFPEIVAAEVHAGNANVIDERDIQAARMLGIRGFQTQLAENIKNNQELRYRLGDIDLGADLFAINEDHWGTLKVQVEAALMEILGPGILAAIATKILYLKRPHLFPICDTVVMNRLMGGYEGDCTQTMACIDAVRKIGTDDANANIINQARTHVSAHLTPEHPYAKMSAVRALDAVLWFDSLELEHAGRHFHLMYR